MTDFFPKLISIGSQAELDAVTIDINELDRLLGNLLDSEPRVETQVEDIIWNWNFKKIKISAQNRQNAKLGHYLFVYCVIFNKRSFFTGLLSILDQKSLNYQFALSLSLLYQESNTQQLPSQLLVLLQQWLQLYSDAELEIDIGFQRLLYAIIIYSQHFIPEILENDELKQLVQDLASTTNIKELKSRIVSSTAAETPLISPSVLANQFFSEWLVVPFQNHIQSSLDISIIRRDILEYGRRDFSIISSSDTFPILAYCYLNLRKHYFTNLFYLREYIFPIFNTPVLSEGRGCFIDL